MDILTALRLAARGMDDDELSAVLDVERREVVRHCRRLAFQGVLIREQMSDGSIINKLDNSGPTGDGRLYFEDQLGIPR
jgi:predicted transcriptional regulator